MSTPLLSDVSGLLLPELTVITLCTQMAFVQQSDAPLPVHGMKDLRNRPAPATSEDTPARTPIRRHARPVLTIEDVLHRGTQGRRAAFEAGGAVRPSIKAGPDVQRLGGVDGVVDVRTDGTCWCRRPHRRYPPMMNADINSPYVHDPVYLGAAHNENARRTLWVVALTRVMMVAEITAGDLTGSMAWLADGFHMAHPCRCVGHHRIRLRLCQAPCQQPVLQLQHRQARRCNPHRPACLAHRQSSPCRCGSAQGKRPDSPPAMRSA